MPREVIFIHSDGHAPCLHPDNLAFVKAILRKYGPFSRVVHIGDEIDNHAISFHDHDPDLPSHGDELGKAIEQLKPYYDLFPRVDILHSNHGSLLLRRGVAHGISRRAFVTEAALISAPKGWKWHDELTLDLVSGQWVYFNHGISSNGLLLTERMGMNTVQGHYHTKFSIQYTSNPHNLHWSMQVGCSFDPHHKAARYSKLNAGRPIIGHGLIINGQPKLLPMLLNRRGRWVGRVP